MGSTKRKAEKDQKNLMLGWKTFFESDDLERWKKDDVIIQMDFSKSCSADDNGGSDSVLR